MPRRVSEEVYRFSELSDKAKERVKYDWMSSDGFVWGEEYLDAIKALAKHFGGKMYDYSIDFFNSSPSYAKFSMPEPDEEPSGDWGGEPMLRSDLGDAPTEAVAWDTSAAPEVGGETRRLLKQLGTYDPVTLKGHGECKLTGYCGDESAIDGFREAFFGGERDLNALMQAAFDTWLAAAQADCADQYTDEQFSENCEANDYWFYADGRMYSGPVPESLPEGRGRYKK